VPPPVPTPEMEIGQLSAELVSLHRHLRALADRWDERARLAGEAARCAGELRDVLDCTPTYNPKDFGRPVQRSSCGAVIVNDRKETDHA
jgi:hypothetical protein